MSSLTTTTSPSSPPFFPSYNDIAHINIQNIQQLEQMRENAQGSNNQTSTIQQLQVEEAPLPNLSSRQRMQAVLRSFRSGTKRGIVGVALCLSSAATVLKAKTHSEDNKSNESYHRFWMYAAAAGQLALSAGFLAFTGKRMWKRFNRERIAITQTNTAPNPTNNV